MHTRASYPHAPPHGSCMLKLLKWLKLGWTHPSCTHFYQSLIWNILMLYLPGGVNLDPHSDEYFDKLVKALELDGPLYAKMDPNTMDQFKEILRKYPEAFHLPGTPLGTIKGFYHNIDTGDSPPVYQLPYRKSPSELCAIKNELQRMLSMNIIHPSHSPYGSLCILVRKPLEKGQPQLLRFVVDCRRLNSVPWVMATPFPLCLISWMPLVGEVICKAWPGQWLLAGPS